ncbi:MAG: helix-turn-helix domain-containing protein [Silicimonas sp.]|nr:helix-turn-helix domain-containing protein [Silicimonas sp.]
MTGRPKTPDTANETENLKGFDDFELRLGDIMRGERATLGKSLLDVQRELKIKATYISAIENTDPSAFDTPGFVAGYVRSYARYLGLDPEWAFQTFCDEGNFTVTHGMSPDASRKSDKAPGVKKSPTAKDKPAHLRDPFTDPSVSYLPKGEALMSGIEPRAIGSIAVLLVLLLGIGYGGWAVLQEVQKVQLTPVDQTPEVLAVLDPLSDAVKLGENDVPDTTQFTAPATDHFDRLSRPEALDVPVLVARDGPISSIDPDTIGALAPSPDNRFASSRAPRPDNMPFAVPGGSAIEPEVTRLDTSDLLPPVQVVEALAPSVALLAVRPSWVRVRGADGTIVFEKILDAGEQFEVPLTEEPATLRAGNAGSLYFAVNGETYGPAGDGPAVIRDVVLSPEKLTEKYAVADATADTDLARFIAVAQADSSSE